MKEDKIKKTYEAPDMEIEEFSVEDICQSSGIGSYGQGSYEDGGDL